MLLGEHAVLHGHYAMVCAINRRITVRLSPLTEKSVRITSALGEYDAPLDNLADHSSFRFVLQAIRQHFSQLPAGFELRIDSEFSADIGFGSSAAVTVATHAALMQWINGKAPAREELFAQCLETVHAVQGRGSGADLAASVFGGCVGFSLKTLSSQLKIKHEGTKNIKLSDLRVLSVAGVEKSGFEFQPLEVAVPLTAVYCGYKTPTPEVIGKVEQLRAADPEMYERIYSEIDASVGEAVSCLRKPDFPAFGKILNRNQQLMDEMGVNTPELQEIVSALQVDPNIYGAKISGSGLGDCAVGIGHADLLYLNYPVHHLEITPIGCEW